MTKQTRSLLILGAILVLLMATWLGSSIWTGRERAEESAMTIETVDARHDLYKLDPSSVAQIILSSQSGDLTLIPIESTTTEGALPAISWSVLESHGLPVQTAVVNRLAEAALYVTCLQEITADSADSARAFGLAEPALRLTVSRKDGLQMTLAIGSDLSSGTGSYARLDQESRVVVVPTEFKTQMSLTLADLIDTSLYKGSITPDLANRFRFERQNDGLDIQSELKISNPGDPSTGYTFQLTAPVARKGNADTLSTLVNRVLALPIVRVVDLNPTDLTPFGLDHPGYRFTLTSETGDELIISLGDSAGDGQYYMSSSALPIVMTVFAAGLPAIDLPLEDYVDRFVALESIWLVSVVAVQLEDTSFELEIDIGQNQPMTGETVVFRLDDQDADIQSETGASLFSDFYQRLIAIQLAGFDWEGEPDPKTVWGRMVFRFKADQAGPATPQERVIEFARRDAYTDYVLIDGTYQGFYVNHKDTFDETRPGYEGIRVVWQQMQYAIDHSVNGVFDTREGYPERA